MLVLQSSFLHFSLLLYTTLADQMVERCFFVELVFMSGTMKVFCESPKEPCKNSTGHLTLIFNESFVFKFLLEDFVLILLWYNETIDYTAGVILFLKITY